MGAKLDLTGEVFGWLTALKYVGKTNLGMSKWACRCSCSNLITATIGSLRSGNTKSCGCLAKELATKLKWKHGQSVRGKVTVEYNLWNHAKNRANVAGLP